MFCCVVIIVLSSFAIIVLRKRESVGLLKLSFWRIVTISVLGFFLMVPWVGLQCVIVDVPSHALLSFGSWSAGFV